MTCRCHSSWSFQPPQLFIQPCSFCHCPPRNLYNKQKKNYIGFCEIREFIEIYSKLCYFDLSSPSPFLLKTNNNKLFFMTVLRQGLPSSDPWDKFSLCPDFLHPISSLAYKVPIITSNVTIFLLTLTKNLTKWFMTKFDNGKDVTNKCCFYKLLKSIKYVFLLTTIKEK